MNGGERRGRKDGTVIGRVEANKHLHEVRNTVRHLVWGTEPNTWEASGPTLWFLALGRWPSERRRAMTRESTVAPTCSMPRHEILATRARTGC